MRVPWMWEGVREKAALERALPKAHRWQKTRDEKNSKMHNFTYIAKTSVMNDAGDMRYSCDVCGERFFVHGHMKRHLYSHTGIKPHACRWTKRIFSTNNSSQVEVWSNICLVWWQNEARESAGDKINDQQEFGWLKNLANCESQIRKQQVQRINPS